MHGNSSIKYTNVSFINFNCTLLLNLLSSLHLFICFTCIFRLPQHNGGGGRWLQWGYHRKQFTALKCSLWFAEIQVFIFWVMLTRYNKKLCTQHTYFQAVQFVANKNLCLKHVGY